jgi:arsenate reductase/regulatory protein spx
LKRVTLYTKSGCSTCIKARQFLLGKGVHYTERDIFKHPFSELELRAIVAQRPVTEIFSYRSPSVKALGLDVERMNDEELIAVMLQEPRLIRRPLLTTGEALAVGFDESQLLDTLAR